jgi:hypothetical protein
VFSNPSHPLTNATATVIFVLRRKLGVEFEKPDLEDVSIIITGPKGTSGYCLCVTFKNAVVICGEPSFRREDTVWGLRKVAESFALV